MGGGTAHSRQADGAGRLIGCKESGIAKKERRKGEIE